jgi:hypothetical protein
MALPWAFGLRSSHTIQDTMARINYAHDFGGGYVGTAGISTRTPRKYRQFQ